MQRKNYFEPSCENTVKMFFVSFIKQPVITWGNFSENAINISMVGTFP